MLLTIMLGRPIEILAQLDYASLAHDSYRSLQRVLIGVAIAAVVGIALGLWRSTLPRWIKNNFLIRFLFDAPKFPPPIAWIPLVILLLGIGEPSAYAIVFIGALPSIFTNTFEGAESIPSSWRQAAASMEVRGFHYFTRFVFMASLPEIFSGLRIGMSMGWMSVIAAEMVAGESGLGYAIQLDRLNLQYGAVVVDILLIGIIGFLLYESIIWLERLVIPWHERSRSSLDPLK